MPLPGYFIPWVIGNTVRYIGKQYGKRIFASAAGSYAGYKALTYKKKKSVKMMTQERPAKRRKFGVQRALFHEDSAGYVQRADIRKAWKGRSVPRNVKTLNMVKSHVDRIIERFQHNQPNVSANTPNSMVGSVTLAYGPMTSGFFHFPMFLYDLTGVYNNNCRSLGSPYPYVMQGVYRPGITPWTVPWEYQSSGLTGRDATDSGINPTWYTELIGTNSSVPKAGQSCYIDGIRINMAIFGAKKVPSKVFVELWQFADDDLSPPGVTNSTDNTISAFVNYNNGNANKINTLFNNLTASCVGTGIGLRGTRSDFSGIRRKVIQTVDFNPTSQSETDADGHQRNLYFYMPMNKFGKYDWDTSLRTLTTAQAENPDMNVNENGTTNEVPLVSSEKRVFLVVRAQIAQGHASSAITPAQLADLYPSYDLIIRRYRSSIKT